jgi:hypothetical protein
MWSFIEEWGLKRFASKGVGFVAAIITSHVVTLLTDPKFQGFWTGWGLTAPQIINKALFQTKLSLTLGMAWIMIDHFISRWLDHKPST